MQIAPGTSLSHAAPRIVPARLRLLSALSSVAVLVYVVDQLTKAVAVRQLTPGTSVRLIGSVLELRLIRNPGAAFSVATGMTWVLTLVAVVVIVIIIRSSRRLGSGAWALALGLLLGGALGNLTDRLVREPGVGRGHVVDFLDYHGWFVGNVADIAIVAAAVMVGVLGLRGIGLDGQRSAHG